MGIFYYYIPGKPDLKKQAKVFNIMPFGDDPLESFTRCGGKAGPDGKQEGMIFSKPGPGIKARNGYYPDEQTWVQVMGVWIGYYKDDPPIPEHLVRPANELVSGHVVDGWIIPTARVFPHGTQLPQSFILNDSGEWDTEIKPEFLRLSKQCEKAFNMITKQDGPELENGELVELSVDGLAINYHVSKREISAGRLLESRTQRHIIFALVDWFTAVDILKENQVAKKKEQ